MYYFKHEFRELRASERSAYAGVASNLNGDKPLICEVYNDDTEVAVIISGDPESYHTIISMITESSEYYIRLEGYNLRHAAIADSIVDYLSHDIDNLEEAIKGAVQDYDMSTFR